MTSGMFATAWEWFREYGLLLAFLFGWLILSWLSTLSARVEGMAMTIGDLRKELDEFRDQVRSHRTGEGQAAEGP